MKRTIVRILIMLVFAALTLFSLPACSNAHWGVNAGVGVTFGPGGPRVVPNINVGVYSGGRL